MKTSNLSLLTFFAKQSHLSKTRLLRRKNLLAMTRTRQADGELKPKRLKGGSRKQKDELVNKMNPERKDLYETIV
ncbi:MAG: hypothetical protein A2Y18_07445 [Clostridiales bacterium GWD2_32_19]|nr:MAG: hypothetical protein A2Y18_07445 [Clostridiales bacterium GWD2_32_19]